MEQYYIATEEGQTEGPYSFASLETFYAEGKITQKALFALLAVKSGCSSERF